MLSTFARSPSLRSQPARQIDQRLALIFGRMFLGVGIEDGALRFALFRQRHDIFRLGSTKQPGDKAVLALIGRRRRAFAAHHAIDGFDGHLARECRRIGLPARNLALARLPRGGGDVQRLLHRLIDRLGRQVEQRADAGRRRGTEMGDMVDLVLVQANALHQIDLDFIGRSQPAHEIRAGRAAMLRHRQQRRNIVAGVRIVGRQERVVEIEFADGDAVRPCGPFRRKARATRQSENRRARRLRMCRGLCPRG